MAAEAQNFYRTTNGGLTLGKYDDECLQRLGLPMQFSIPATNGLHAVSSGWLWRTLNGGVRGRNFHVHRREILAWEITQVGQSFLLPVAGQSCSGTVAAAGGMAILQQ